MSSPEQELTADIVFERLERLRELLRLVDHLREYRPEGDQRRAGNTPQGPSPLTK